MLLSHDMRLMNEHLSSLLYMISRDRKLTDLVFATEAFRSGSSCSGSLSSSGGDRSPGGYLRLDPNLPISSQFHDYFCNPLLTGVSFESQLTGSSNKGHKTGARSTSDSRSVTSTRSRKQTLTLISPGKKYSTSESLSEGESAFSGIFEHSAGAASVGSVFDQTDGSGAAAGSSARASSKGSKAADPETSIRHRELHKTLEKNRRAHLRHCFEELRKELPKSEYSYKKSSHINIIHSAIRYINSLKKAEWENEHELERLARCKMRHQNHLAQIRQETGRRGTGSFDARSSPSSSGSTSCSASSSKSSSPPTSEPLDQPLDQHNLSTSAPAAYSWSRSAAVSSALES